MYRLLFLDTETTAVTPQKGEIIEIAGLIVELDPATGTMRHCSHFQTLVKPSGQLGDHVTRLTGIDAAMLVSAPSLFVAQEAWAQWLEKNNPHAIDAIVGHSISFDLSFLSHYSWFLPTQAYIDTLDIANIWCSDARAVNLEFLTHQFGLREPATQLCNEMNGALAHRALYDAAVCAVLFERLLERSTRHVASQWHASLIHDFFGPIDIPRYVSDHTLAGSNPSKDRTILWSNTLKTLSFAEQIDLVRATHTSLIEVAAILQSLCGDSPPPRAMQRIILAVLWATASSDQSAWFHGHGYADFWYLQRLWEILLPAQLDHETQYHTPPLEELLIQQRQLSTVQLNSVHWLALLDITIELTSTDQSYRQPAEALSQVLDFFTFSISKMSLGSFFSLQKHAADPNSQYIRERLQALSTASKAFASPISSGTTVHPAMLQAALSQCLEYHQLLTTILHQGSCDIQLHESGVYLEQLEPNKMNQLIGAVMAKHPTINSFLSPSDAAHTLTLLKLTSLIDPAHVKSPPATTPEPKHYPKENLWDLYEQSKGRCALFLLSTNKILRQAEEYLTESGVGGEYLLFGEHGSITKIISKIHTGYRGPVFVRIKDWNILITAGLAPIFEQVVLVELPPVSIPAHLFAPHRVGDAGVLFAHRSMAAQALAGQVAHYCAQPLYILS